jgi:aryl-alcohol dehydrogenase-like predicted oxidoreductase
LTQIEEVPVAQSLPQRAIGKSGIQCSAIGLGCMSLSNTYGASDDNESIALIHEALDRGVNMLDSSDLYGAGHNETLIGKALAGRRAGVILATKFGNLGGKGGKFADGRPEFVVASCEASLKRLNTDVIDLYYAHRIDPTVPIEDTVGAMARLKQQGKIRALGLSEASPSTIERAHKEHAIAAVQNEYSLLYRKEGEETLPVTRRLGISFVAYAPLGRGLMTGQIADPSALADTDSRKRHPRYSNDNLDHNRALAQKVEAIAKRKGCTPAQLALAWVLAQGPDVIPIPGTKQMKRVTENIGALNVKLSDAELAEIASAVPAGAVKGTRYPEAQMASLYI